jgi:uncharacterized protein (DUF952 family)
MILPYLGTYASKSSEISGCGKNLCEGGGAGIGRAMAEAKTLIYKIMAQTEWAAAVQAGVFTGSAVDVADGYIHFSGASQVKETAAKYFAGQNELALIAFEAGQLSPLKWEASRGGALFPHLYGPLDPALALWARPLPWDGASHVFPVL